ncbi:MAG: hypothetical protein KatS3mg059_0194 [Thermomicrobiales bacterium]|nr:MAG: hypothetical protein KatS3mg059_0194 [Thermomicrobiales bacterium]
MRWVASASPSVIALIALLLAAFALRVFRLNWDEGTYLHPDEMHVADVTVNRIRFDWPPDLDNLLDPSVSRLNPRSDDPATGQPRGYAYGALPVIVTRGIATILTWLTGSDWTSYFDHIHLVGRALSALVDTSTVLLTYLLAARLLPPRLALVSALLYALAPIPIQLAHFYTTDTWLTLFATATLLFAVLGAQTGSFTYLALSGAAFGFAMASKGSIAALAGVIILAAVLGPRPARSSDATNASSLMRLAWRASVPFLAALAAFALFEPYALARPSVYLDQIFEQSRIVAGSLDVPFTRQYVGTMRGWYQVSQLVRWGLGPVAGVACLAGFILVAHRAVSTRAPAWLVLICGVLLQGMVVLWSETKFIRYVAPLVPALAVGGALAIGRLHQVTGLRLGRRSGGAIVALVLAGVAAWTLAFASIYAGRNPRLEASRWIYDNLPSGSVLASPTWDETLPVPLGLGLAPWDFQYQLIPLEMYLDRPPEQVADDLYHVLEQADAIILPSNRVERGIRQQPWRYPVQNQFYRLLRRGSLGFTLASEFRRDPRLLGISIDDQQADESLLNYDHPRVEIYRKSALISRRTYDLLMAQEISQPFLPVRHLSSPTLMLDQPVSTLPVVNDGRWSATITSHSAGAIAAWIALLVILQFAGWPLARLIFARFADAGWGLSRLIALLPAAYLVWIGASLRVLSFRVGWCLAALALVAALGMAIRSSPTLLNPVRSWRVVLAGEGIFWGVFALFFTFRIINPDSWHPEWGGEKPMEFAHINAILRSAHFPPYDPWYAGGYLNYYYYGLYLVAFCFKVTGIPSEIAFNLAQPTVIALLASAGYSVAATLGGSMARRVSPAVPGALAALLLVGAGNLAGFVHVVERFPSPPEPSFLGLTWAASRAITGAITEFPFFTGLYADLHAHVVALPLTVLVIALCYAIASQPRLMLVALSESTERSRARLLLTTRLALLTLALGTLFPTNAWDVPVYSALAVVAISMAFRRVPSRPVRLALTTLTAGAVGLGAFLLFLPFHQHFVTLFSAIGRTRAPSDIWQVLNHLGGLLAIAGLGLMVVLLTGAPLDTALLSYPPLPIAVIGGSLVVAGVSARRVGWLSQGMVLVSIVTIAALLSAAAWSGLGRKRLATKRIAAIAGAGFVACGAAAVLRYDALALMIAFLTAGAALWLADGSSAQRFTGALIAAGAGVAGGVELLYVVDDLNASPVWYRMNTVFKFYNQAWVLFALGAASLLGTIIEHARAQPAARPATLSNDLALTHAPASEVTSQPLGNRLASLWARAGLVIAVISIGAALCYPVLATAPRLELRFPGHPAPGTLDALDWMRYGTITNAEGEHITFAGDKAVIDWFNSQVAGTPVIAEASIGPYRGNGSRISIATGLPTILGWDRHEFQQRFPEGILERDADVRTLYDSPDPETKLGIIAKYGVEYVIVGDVERKTIIDGERYASEAGLNAFDEMVGRSLEIAFRAGTTTVYRVIEPSPGVPAAAIDAESRG